MRTRRFIIASALAAASAPGAFAQAGLEARLAEIERPLRGRMGVAWLGPSGEVRASQRGDERFLMCSTFKVFLAAAVLRAGKTGALRWTADDLISNSPVLAAQPQGGAMERRELCRAAVTMSDNTAANLLLSDIGGPLALTDYVRSLGDQVTRHDRMELELNIREFADDVRDTSTPLAFVRTLRRVIGGGGLPAVEAGQLAHWMIETQNQPNRLRAGLPRDWEVGVKPGTNTDYACNDVGFFTRPGGQRQFLAVFIHAPDVPHARREAAIADVARAVAAAA
jgi:beta-lactamase class A